MPEFDHQPESQSTEAEAARVTTDPTPAQIHKLVVRTAGHPARLAHLLRKASPSLRKALIGEAQRLFGNQFVQAALKIEARHGHGHDHDEPVVGGGSD